MALSLVLCMTIAMVPTEKHLTLLSAAESGDLGTVQRMLQAGADVNTTGDHTMPYGETPLHLAAEAGHREVVALLLEKGARIDQENFNGETPLAVAAWRGHLDVVALLLAKGAEVNQRIGNNGETALHMAALGGHRDVAALLLEEGTAIDQATSSGTTPLLVAASEGRRELVALLLAKGAAINRANSSGQTPLAAAAWNGHREVVALLLEKGAAVNRLTPSGTTPLYDAASGGHREIVRLLLEHGAEVDQAASGGDGDATPLSIAAQEGSQAVVALLLEQGAAVNQTTQDGKTPLHTAASRRHRDVVSLLMRNGASVLQADAYGQTPLHSAAIGGDREIVALFLEQGAALNQAAADGATPLYFAAWNGNQDVVELLLTHRADIRAASKRGDTPLHVAAFFGHEATVQLLLKAGADTNARNRLGERPVDQARRRGHRTLIPVLEPWARDAKQKQMSDLDRVGAGPSSVRARTPKGIRGAATMMAQLEERRDREMLASEAERVLTIVHGLNDPAQQTVLIANATSVEGTLAESENEQAATAESWPARPLMEGNWQELPSEELFTVMQKLRDHRNALSQYIIRKNDWPAPVEPSRLRKLALPCYDNVLLIEAEIRKAGEPPGVLSFILHDRGINTLYGRGAVERIRQLNKWNPPRLSTPEQAATYLKFVIGVMDPGEGNFRVLDGAHSVDWKSDVDRAAHADLEEAIRPLEMRKTEQGWIGVAIIQYKADIYRAELALLLTGEPRMLDDHALGLNLPIKATGYAGGTFRYDALRTDE